MCSIKFQIITLSHTYLFFRLIFYHIHWLQCWTGFVQLSQTCLRYYNMTSVWSHWSHALGTVTSVSHWRSFLALDESPSWSSSFRSLSSGRWSLTPPPPPHQCCDESWCSQTADVCFQPSLSLLVISPISSTECSSQLSHVLSSPSLRGGSSSVGFTSRDLKVLKGLWSVWNCGWMFCPLGHKREPPPQLSSALSLGFHHPIYHIIIHTLSYH